MSETPEALKLKIAKLEGKIQMLDESNTKLSQENAALNYKVGTLNNQLAAEKKYRVLLGYRGRIEHLEKTFGAKELLNGRKATREETWLVIFDNGRGRLLNDLKIKIFDAGLTIEEFCRAIGFIYGDSSDRAAHNCSLPKEVRSMDIEQIIELLEIEDDEPVEAALNILKQKLKLVNDEDVPKSLLNSSSSSSNSGVRFSESLSKVGDKGGAKTEFLDCETELNNFKSGNK